MPISNSYPKGIPIEDQDLFVGTKANNNRTVNYTAQGVADYLNINSKVAIGGQMSFQFTTVPNIPKTIAFEGGLGDGTAFSDITKLIVSSIDLSSANITIFLNYLNNSQILLSQQNQPNFFGHYIITGYTQIGTSAFYELDLEFIGGNGTIGDKQYYDLVSFVLSTEVPPTEWGTIVGDIENQTDLINYVASELTPYFLKPTGTTLQYVRGDGSLATFPSFATPTIQQVLTAGNTTTNGIQFTGGYNGAYVYVFSSYISIGNSSPGNYTFITPEQMTYGYGSLIASYTSRSGFDVENTSETTSKSGGINAGSMGVSDNNFVTGILTTTYIRPNEITIRPNFVAAEEISIISENQTIEGGIAKIRNLLGQNETFAFLSDIPSLTGYVPTSRTLTINGTTYDLTADRSWTIPGFTSPLTTKGDLFTFSTVNARLPVGLDTQILIADSTSPTGLKWGSNTVPTPTGYYGAWQDNITQTAAASNVGYAMIFRTIDLSNGVSVVTNGTNLTRITFANTGIYNLQFSSQFQNLSNSPQDVTIWLRLNGVDIPGSAGIVGLEARKNPGDPYHIVTGWNYLLDIVAGQYYELVWSTTDHTNVQMQYYAAGSPPPSAASVIMTVTQQSGIMAGTGMTSLTTTGSGGPATYNSGTGALNIPQYMSASTRRNANNSSNNNINYCGVALGTGVSESSAVWTIKRLTIAASGSITTATATNVAWTNRESASYT